MQHITLIKDMTWKFKYKRRSLLSAYCYNNNFIKLPYPPLEVFIEPTNNCDLKCIICPHSFGLKRKKGFMSWDTFEKILRQIAEAKVLRVTLNFAGEPLLNKNIFDMIRLSKANNLYTRIHTNASFLLEDSAKKIVNSGLDELSFSFDDHRKDIYEKIRVNANYDRTLANIKFFLEVKKRLKAKKPFTIIQRIKMSNFNYSDYNDDNDYQNLFAGLPVDKFYTIFTHNWAGSCQDYFIEKYQSTAEKSPCVTIWSRFAIGWDGIVFACCNEMNGKLAVGDLNTQNLMDIWNGPEMIDLRRQMLGNKYGEIEACRDCDVLLRSKRFNMSIAKKWLAKLFLNL